MLLPYAGSIKIDGVEVRDIPRDKFKDIFTIIPEKPVIFPSATIRQNLLTNEIMNPIPMEGDDGFNPMAALLDEELQITLFILEKILRGVGLWDIVDSGGGLNTTFSTFAFSSTQLQKFSLAQGLTKYYFNQTKMTIIDGTTSHVSAEGLARMKSFIDEILGMDKECMVITTSSTSDPIERSQYVARIAGGRVFKFFVESMIRRPGPPLTPTRQPIGIQDIPLHNRYTINVAEGSGQNRQRRLEDSRRASLPSGSGSSAPIAHAQADAVAGPSTPSAALVAQTSSQIRRRIKASRHQAATQRPQHDEVQVAMLARRQANAVASSSLVQLPTILHQTEIPSWMNEFAHTRISETRERQLYLRILQYGSVRLQSLVLEHRLRDLAVLSEIHRRQLPASPRLAQQQARESHMVVSYYRSLEAAVLAAQNMHNRREL